MIESLEQKKRRLFGNQYSDEYRVIINKITISNSNNFKILSIPETDNLIDDIANLKLKSSVKLLFNEKLLLKKNVLEKLNTVCGIYLFTSLSKDCGAVLIDSINLFNFNFNFTDDDSGIISIVASNLKDKILLDFYEEDGTEYIEIEHFQ